jgi:hypothetical protein
MIPRFNLSLGDGLDEKPCPVPSHTAKVPAEAFFKNVRRFKGEFMMLTSVIPEKRGVAIGILLLPLWKRVSSIGKTCRCYQILEEGRFRLGVKTAIFEGDAPNRGRKPAVWQRKRFNPSR